ncbi:MAG: hypothetical protein COA42_14200 [Alteromonadaceae bacterium]|nr:MAG: hypothetical protein COA42_14200 [Alteromonadaceae bacterium]
MKKIIASLALAITPAIASAQVWNEYEITIDVIDSRGNLEVEQIQEFSFPTIRVDDSLDVGATCTTASAAPTENELCRVGPADATTAIVNVTASPETTLLMTLEGSTVDGFRILPVFTSTGSTEDFPVTPLAGEFNMEINASIELVDFTAVTGEEVTLQYMVHAEYL